MTKMQCAIFQSTDPVYTAQDVDDTAIFGKTKLQNALLKILYVETVSSPKAPIVDFDFRSGGDNRWIGTNCRSGKPVSGPDG